MPRILSSVSTRERTASRVGRTCPSGPGGAFAAGFSRIAYSERKTHDAARRSWAEAKNTGPLSLTRALTTASSGANGQPDPPFSCALSSFSTPSLTGPRARVETATATRRAVSISGRSAFSCRARACPSARGRGRARAALHVRRDAQCVLARLAHPKACDSSARRRRLRPRLARVSPRPPSILAPAERREWVEIGQRPARTRAPTTFAPLPCRPPRCLAQC